jgi:hypothetical protein
MSAKLSMSPRYQQHGHLLFTQASSGGSTHRRYQFQMTLFQRIDIDLDAERDRITKYGTFNKRQQRALLKLCELFEAGDFQGCLNLINDGVTFPYNSRGEYPESEHIGIEIGNVLHDVANHNIYTRDQLLEEAAQRLKAPSIKL